MTEIQSALDLIRALNDMYLDNMEGCDASEFEFWTEMHRAAQTILDAMIREKTTGIPYPPDYIKNPLTIQMQLDINI